MTAHTLRASVLTVRGGIAELVHNRPEARNPLSSDLRQDYADMLDRVEADDSVRVLRLRGAGGSFCAGGDLAEMKQRVLEPGPDAAAATRRRIAAASVWLRRLLALRAVVIAEVDGPAVGAGFSLALHADFVLASDAARFCMSFARVGAVPDFGAHHLLPRVVGLAAARDLLLTGRMLGAREAHRLGIVHAVVPSPSLAESGQRMAVQFLQAPAEALAMSKAILLGSFETGYAAVSAMEAQSQAIAMASAYHADAVMRFTARQPLRYDWDRDGPAPEDAAAP